jgi:hypothetical protein
MLLGHRLRGWNVGEEFTVLGLVDLDAVPSMSRILAFRRTNQ